MKKMAFYILFKNKNTVMFLYFICLLFNLQMCQIILPDSVYVLVKKGVGYWHRRSQGAPGPLADNQGASGRLTDDHGP